MTGAARDAVPDAVMDAGERALIAETLGRACRDATGAELDRALLELGWAEALAVDPRLAVAGLFGPLGRSGATCSALEAVVGSALPLGPGGSRGTVLPALGRTDPPGRMAGGVLVMHGVMGPAHADAPSLQVVAEADQGPVVVAVTTGDLVLRPVHGVDPGLGLVEVSGGDVTAEVVGALGPDDWRRATARGQLAVGHQLVGASRAILELARDHALARVQFDQPIADFQAVRHRLADTLVAIEAADALLASAWEEGSPEAAASAKALAGRTARTAARHGQQVLAGIGFTTQHDLHHYVRRILVLDQLFGTSRSLTRALGQRLLATRRLPALPPL